MTALIRVVWVALVLLIVAGVALSSFARWIKREGA